MSPEMACAMGLIVDREGYKVLDFSQAFVFSARRSEKRKMED
jgi:hypothetical protein